MVVINALLPLVVGIVLGYVLRRSGKLSAEACAGCNWLAFWVALPALLVLKIGATTTGWTDAARLVALVLVVTVIGVIGTLIVARLTGLPTAARGVVTQGVFRGNLAFVGLPVIVFGLAGHPQADQLVGLAGLTLGPVVVVYNIVSVVVLSWYADDVQVSPGLFVTKLAGNPLVIACIIGLVVAGTGVTWPVAVANSLDLLAKAALFLALIGLGGGMVQAMGVEGSGWRSWRLPTMAAIAKVGLLPVVGYGIGRAAGIDADLLPIACAYLATPTAVASYVLVSQLGGDRDLGGRIVCASTLLSLVSLAVVLLFWRT